MFFDLDSPPRLLYGTVRFRQSLVSLPFSQASQLIAAENPDRVFLMFALFNNSNYWVWPFSQVTQTTGTGIQLGQSNASPYFSISLDKDGPIVQHEWYGQAAQASAMQAAVVEAIVEDWDRVKGRHSNASVSARGTPSDRSDRQLADWVESVTRGADNQRPIDKSLYALIRRRGGRP